jgi:acyl-CoA reductase-like NAD-dependent aldehyde dehydrogenase
MPPDTVTTQLYINGTARAASDGGTYQLHNPARPSELVGHVAAGTESDADDAVRAAHLAYPAWSALSYAERAAQLNRVADLLVGDEAEVEARSRLFTREHGKVRRETMLEITRLGDRFRQTAGYAERLAIDETIPGPPFDAIVTRQPRGVAVLVVPWNWPLAILGAKLPQALMAGNTVVVKPSENAALAPTITLHMIAAALPPGVVNIVTGDSIRIGDQLTGHALTRFVNFTGSIAIGRHVMKVAAENLTPVTLELGGNDPGIVLEDAVLDEAAFARLYNGAFMSTGQICMALKRLYVHRSRYDEVVAGIIAVAKKQVVGDGLLNETTMGPLNNLKQLNVVRTMIAEARAAGADVQEFGIVPDQELYQTGYFQRPTFVFNADPRLRVVHEEQFGPVLPIMVFDTEAEVIAAANDSSFGLCSSVWTADRDRAVAIARKLEAGFTYLNAHGPAAQDGRSPFGGFKHSGIGRNMGYEGVTQFQCHHAISGPAGWLL